MDLDNFIIGKTKERRGEGRFGKKKQLLLNKHSAAADGKIQDNKSWASPGRFDKKSNNCQTREKREELRREVSRREKREERYAYHLTQ